MKLIIAGGRYYHLSPADHAFLDEVVQFLNAPITEVVTGGASGADRGGMSWAASRNIPTRTFLPNWDTYGRAAGPIRNHQMAEYVAPDGAVVLFPGGRGTESMRNEAAGLNLRVFES